MQNIIFLVIAVLLANWIVCIFYTKDYFLVGSMNTGFVLSLACLWCVPILGPMYIHKKIKNLAGSPSSVDASQEMSFGIDYDDSDDR